jgi:serine/threonine protein kinase
MNPEPRTSAPGTDEFERHAIRAVGELMDLDGPERARRLGEIRVADPELGARVDALLGRAERLGGFLTGAGWDMGGPAEGSVPPGTRLGGYVIGGLLGVGATAEVYEAQRDEPGLVRSDPVAFKLIRPGPGWSGADDDRVLSESRAQARLDHPAIARWLDGGIAEVGGRRVPYLVTELAPGPPVTLAAAHAGLSVAQRLELMAEICEGVEHAHRRRVLHRDLKPANILTAPDAAGRLHPKIVDFGLARMARHESGDGGEAVGGFETLTRPNDLGLGGSLAYMSPEALDQLESGESKVLDTRSDVYALGVVLFELLTGRLPHGGPGQPVLSMIRAVREDEAPRIETIVPQLGGDLSLVVARALAKDPGRRYASAGAFADDLRRVVRGEAVSARAPGTLYLLRRSVLRHPVLAAVVGVGSVTLLAGTAVSSVQWARAARAEARAVDRMEAALAASAAIVEEVVPQLQRVSGTSEASTRLLEGLIGHIETLYREAPDDPRVLRRLWELTSELGGVSSGWTLERRLENATRSRDLLVELARLQPHDQTHTINLQQAEAWVAQLSGVADRAALHRSQLPPFVEAISAESDPARRAAIRVLLAYRMRLIANWESDRGFMGEAIAMARLAHEESPDDPETSCELGSGLATLAAMLTDTDRVRAGQLADEARLRLLEARDLGLGDHESIVRQLGGLEVEMARIYAGDRPAGELLALAGGGLARYESFVRQDPGRADMRRDWGYQLAAYARAASYLAERADASSQGGVRAEALARLQASIREYEALPPLDIGVPTQAEFVARAREAAEPLASDLP